MAFYGVGIEVKVKELLLQIKMQIQNKPGRGIRYLKVLFRRYDTNGNSKLDAAEFEDCLSGFG
jgi:EF-hand domain